MSAYTSQVANISTSFVEFFKRQSKRNAVFSNSLDSHLALILEQAARITELEKKLKALTDGLESAVGEIRDNE